MGHILALGRVDNPGNTFSLDLGVVLGHRSVLDNCSLGIHFSDFTHSHLVGDPHSHSFLVGLCNVHMLDLGTILGHSCCPNHVGINHDFDNDFLWGSHWSLEEVSVVG